MRTAELTVLPKARPEESRVAVLVNANARRVSERVIRQLSHVVPEGDLFVSRSELDARRIAQSVVDRQYPVVFCGGGDGTVMSFATEIHHQLEQRRRLHPQRAPRFGVLKLGTGNSMAAMLQASSLKGDGILDDVLRARTGEVPGYRRVDLLSVNGKRAPFAGLGVDGKLLNDYLWVKQNLGRGPLRSLLTGGGGYFTSVAFKTVPHYLVNSTWVDCEVVNGQVGEAYLLDSDGQPTATVAPGEVLYRGKLMMAAASTAPFYGYELRMFPFAGRRRGMMHLRLAAVSAPNVLANLPGLWSGRWFPNGVYDYHAREVHLRFDKPMPLQIAGDAAGYQRQLTLSMCGEPLEMLDFSGAVN